MNSLHLERKLVLDSSQGPTFKTGSAALSPNAKRKSMHSSEITHRPARPDRRRHRIASSWSPDIPTASAMRPTTTISDSGGDQRGRISGRQQGP